MVRSSNACVYASQTLLLVTTPQLAQDPSENRWAGVVSMASEKSASEPPCSCF